jgi:beta-lactamase regulating signal transducer with metallopeptidase domain
MMNQHFVGLLMTQIWQIAALAIVVAVIVRLAARNRPHLAHALWILVLVKCVTPPFWGHSLGVFSQLRLQLSRDEATAIIIEPETNRAPVDVPAISLSAPHVDASSAGGQSLEFPAHDELVAELETESPAEIGSTEYSDYAMEYDESPPAIVAAIVDAPDSATDAARYRSMLVITICTGAIITMLIMMFRCFRCVRLIHQHRAPEFDELLRDRIQQLARQLGIRRTPQVIVSDVLFGPAVFGLLRHTIALPRCLFENTEGESALAPTSARCRTVAAATASSARVAQVCEVQAGRQDLQFLNPILAHELIHIRRGDLLTGALQVIVQSLWWFHPAVWFLNRWLSREAERCCDEEVIAELGCTPGQYARSLLRVIECKHRLQPIPVFPGMKPVEITSQRMERIMSLNNGLKKRTPFWCWLLVLALAFVVLPGAIAKPTMEEKIPTAVTSGEDPNAGETTVVSAPQVEVSTKTYEVGDLVRRLTEEYRISSEAACESLIGILEKAVSPVMELPSGFPATPKVAGTKVVASLMAHAPRQVSSISSDGDQLIAVQSDVGHAKLKEEIDRFQKFGFKRFQVRTRFIMGPAEEINTLLTTLNMAAAFSNIEKTPSVETRHNPAHGEVPEKLAVTTYLVGLSGIVSRDNAQAIEEIARSKSDCFTVECPQVQAFNGQTALTHVGETRPCIVGFRENDEPVIRTVNNGLTLHVTPTAIDDGLLGLQCVCVLEGVAEKHFVSISRRDSESPPRILLPMIASKRVQTNVEIREDQTLLLTGVMTTHDGKSDAVLVVLDAMPISLVPPTDLIQLDESFIPSPDMRISGDTILARVADKKISVADVLGGLVSRADNDAELTPGLRQEILLSEIVRRLPAFLCDEVLLHEYHRTMPAEKQTKIRSSLKPKFAEIQQKLVRGRNAKDTDELERMLVAEGFSIAELRESFMRQQIVEGYRLAVPEDSPILDRVAIECHCRQLLFEARLRQKVSLAAKQSFSLRDLLSLGEQYGVSVSCIAISDEDFRSTIAADIVDRPLLYVLRTIVEPSGLKFAVGREEIVLTPKPREQPRSEIPEPETVRVETLPMPDWIQESNNPLAKQAWEALESTRGRLLSTGHHQPASEQVEVEVPRLMRVYSVADLVAYKNPVGVAVRDTGDSGEGAEQLLPSAVAVAHARENTSNQSEPNPTLTPESSSVVSPNLKPDFAPLTELIKATVQPETWELQGSARIAVDQESLGLVILQTPTAHDEIADLLSQLRHDTDQSVSIQCRIVRLTNDSQTAWLEKQCSLYPLQQGSRWALLPQQRSEAFEEALLEQEPEVLSVPTVMTISGQKATISVGQSASNETAPTGIRLELTPHLLAESKVIRLQHSFSISAFDQAMLDPVESLVGSGQMLLVLIDAPENKQNAAGEKSDYLLMLTPQHLLQSDRK